MTNSQLEKIIQESSLALGQSIDPGIIEDITRNVRSYDESELQELKRDLIESARKVNLAVFDNTIVETELADFLKESLEVVLLFHTRNNILTPVLVRMEGKTVKSLLDGKTFRLREFANSQDWLTAQGGISCLTLMKYSSFTGSSAEGDSTKLSPVKRLFRLLGTERKDIAYIMVYALIIGMVSLMLPIGLQSTVELVSGGVFFSSVYVLIGLVIVGVLATGILQIVQLSLVEHLQQKIFAKGAFEFAFRIPKIKMEALDRYYAPELVNRFFDIITVQKGLPKILIELSSAAIQILFGLILMSLYHPFFVFFGIFLISILAIMLAFTGKRGLSSSIEESKYKYKVVQWLEEMARAIHSFKLMGNTDLPYKRTDGALANYLKHRKSHFSVLMIQFSSFVFVKVAVTGALLILGTILVVNREITLGQFVAAEVVIILVLAAVEKMIMHTEVVYDMLTAVDKVAHLTDLPLERSGGLDFPRNSIDTGYSIELNNLTYKFKDSAVPILKGLNLRIEKKERICISGTPGSGKSLLAHIISGLYTDYQGGISVNGYSLRDIDLAHLRDKVSKNISNDDIFDGTLYDNILLGKAIRPEEAIEALKKVGLHEYVSALPEGLQTKLISGGKGLSNSTIHKLILARCLAKKPELLILNNFFSGLSKSDRIDLIQCVIDPAEAWTLVAVSNDPLVMAASDRVIIMDKGQIIETGSYETLYKNGVIQKYIE
ncbi:MAG: ATP-binding cassette domain-containing protein [Cyclobacteriaceae bacterium]|nr:ATP-binding cassette domain-containing protein [Cyclobacteriaceae bacterium]